MTAPSVVILAGGRSSRMGMPKAALPFGASTILERLIDTLTGAFAEIIVVAAPLTDEPFSIDRILKNRPELSPASPAIVLTGPPTNFKYRTSLIIERDATAFDGPVGALRRGLQRARAEIVFACSCDLPLLRADLAATLCTMLESDPVSIPPSGQANSIPATGDDADASMEDRNPSTPVRRHDAAIPSIERFPQPLCAAYRREPAVAALLAMESAGERRLRMLADRLNVNVIDEVALRAFDPDLRSFFNVNTAEDYARALRLARPV